MKQDTSIKIEIAAHGAETVQAQYATMADTLARIASAEGDAAAKAALFAAEAKKADERVAKLRAQVETWAAKLAASGNTSDVAKQKLATLQAQIAEVSSGMARANEEAARWGARADRVATAQAELAAVAAGAAQAVGEGVDAQRGATDAAELLTSATQEAAEAQARLTVEEAKAAQVAAQAAAARIEQGRAAARLDAEREAAVSRLAAARQAEDDAATAAAQAELRALDAVQKAALSGLRPYERTAFLLEQTKLRYADVIGATDSYAAAVGNLTRRLDDQTRRSLENRDRSISALLDQVKGAVQAEHRSVRAIQTVAGSALDALTGMVPGLGAVRQGIQGVTASAEQWQAETAQTRARQIELLDALKAQAVELDDLKHGIQAQRRALEGMGADTDEARRALENLGQAEAQIADRAAAVAKAQREVADSIRSTSEQSQRGAATIGAMVGTLAAVVTAAAAAGAALLSLGHASATMGAQIQDAASRAGVGVTEMSRYRALLARMSAGGAEIEMRDLAEAIAEVSIKLNDAADPASEQARLFAALGLEVSRLRGQKPEAVFEAAAGALARITDEGTRTDAAMRLFGDDVGLKLLPVLREGQGALEKYRRANDELGLTLSTDAVAANLKYQQSVRALGLEWDAATERIGQSVTAITGGVLERLQAKTAAYSASLRGMQALVGGASLAEAQQVALRGMEAAKRQREAVDAAAQAEAQALTTRRESRTEAETYAAILRGEVAEAWARAEKAVEAEMEAEEKASGARKAAQEKRVQQRAAALALLAELELAAMTEDDRRQAQAVAQRRQHESQVAEAVKARVLTAAEGERALSAIVAAETMQRQQQQTDAEAKRQQMMREAQARISSVLAAGAEREQGVLERIAEDERRALKALADIYAEVPELAQQAEAAMRQVREQAAAQRTAAAVQAERELQKQIDSIVRAGMTDRQQAELDHERAVLAVQADLGTAYAEALRRMEAAGTLSDERRVQLRETYERTLSEATRQGVAERQRVMAAEAAQAQQAWQQVVSSVLASVGQAATAIMAQVQQSGEAAAAAVERIEQRRADATTDAEREMYDAQLETARKRLARERADALKLFRVQQALQLAQAAMAATLAVIQSLAAPGGASNPLNVAAAVAAGVAGAAAVAQVATQAPPAFHAGGVIGQDTRQRATRGAQGDEHIIKARAGERVLTPAQQRDIDVRLSSLVEVQIGRRGVAAITAEQRRMR